MGSLRQRAPISPVPRGPQPGRPVNAGRLNILSVQQVLSLNPEVGPHHPDDLGNISAGQKNLLIRVFVPLMAGKEHSHRIRKYPHS